MSKEKGLKEKIANLEKENKELAETAKDREEILEANIELKNVVVALTSENSKLKEEIKQLRGRLETSREAEEELRSENKKLREEKPQEKVIILETKILDIWENQRRKTLFHPFSPQSLMRVTEGISERGTWSDEKGNDRDKREPIEPGWEWDGDWEIDLKRKGVDEEGWEYGLSWGIGVTGGGMSERSFGAHVRHRRWIRKMKRVKTSNADVVS